MANRVLLVGWATADWPTIRPLLDRGVMPALAKLVGAGVSGNIAPVQPALSSMLWTSLATGKRADKHGICSYFEPLPDRSGIQPISSDSRKCQAIWNILSAAEMKSHIIGWPATSPAEAILGSVASDRFFSFPNDDQGDAEVCSCHPAEMLRKWRPLAVSPAYLSHDVWEAFFPTSELGRHATPFPPVGFAEAFAAASSVHAVACRQIESDPWDFAAVLYPTIADWGSGLQRRQAEGLHRVQSDELALRNFNDEAAWRFQDEMLSTLIRLAGEETTILLVSPQPIQSPMPALHSTARRFGIACMSGPRIHPAATFQGATVLDVAPTILNLLGLPIGDDMDGWPWQQSLIDPPRIRRTATWELIADRMFPPAIATSPPAGNEPASQSADSNETVGSPACEIVLRNQKINLALALDDSNRAHLAINHWEELVAANPHDSDLCLHLISRLMRNEERLECRHFIERLAPKIAEHSQVQLALAELEFYDRRRSEATRIACKQAERSPSDPGLLNRAGNLLLKCEAWKEAEIVFLKSAEAQSDNPIARNGLATVYWEESRYEESIREVRQALAAAPAFTEARFNLARSLQSLGNEAEAIDAFEHCLAMDYQPQETHVRLAALYRLRDPLRAKEHRSRAGVR